METKIFAAKLEHLHEMLDFLKAYCLSHDFSPAFIEQVTLAGEEALVNIISYSYQKEDAGLIDLSCGKADKKGIKIIIKDNGMPFNPLENVPSIPLSADRLLEKTEDSIGGYGIYILTGIMDAVDYHRINDQNVLTLTKFA